MIDSLTIFSKGGSILYCYNNNNTNVGGAVGAGATNIHKNKKNNNSSSHAITITNIPTDTINQLIDKVLLENRNISNKCCQLRQSSSSSSTSTNTVSNTTRGGGGGGVKNGGGGTAAATGGNLIAEWEEGGPRTTTTRGRKTKKKSSKEWIAVVLYKQILKNRVGYVRDLLKSTLHEFALFHSSVVANSCNGIGIGGGGGWNNNNNNKNKKQNLVVIAPAHVPPPDPTLFHATFSALLRRAEKSRITTARPPHAGSSSFEREEDEQEDEEEKDSISSSKGETEEEDEYGSEEEGDDESEEEEEEEEEEDEDENNNNKPLDTTEGLAKLRARRERALMSNNKKKKMENDNKKKKKKKGKEKTVWHDESNKVTKAAMESLDRSKKKDANTNDTTTTLNKNDIDDDDDRALQEARAAYLPDANEVASWEEIDTLNDDDVHLSIKSGIGGVGGDESADSAAAAASSAAGGGSGSSKWFFQNFVEHASGNKILTEEDVQPILHEMKKTLISKNVGNDIAIEICDGVQTILIGKRLKSFGRIQSAVRMALETSISRMLTPHKNIDVLRDIMAKKEQQMGGISSSSSFATRYSRKPYVIVMVGINGVGKSTSLAKIAYYLKRGGCKPLIAACDTFRSGAVEQLNVHSKCLQVPLFQRGYARDPSSVAKLAISHATSEGYDVVLVDTAGRMQNNVPLMLSLSKLIVENKPDLVLFVGEALVGNDGVDQLKMFNGALQKNGHDRNIDGIVLTKFDTVSDKVGAALTMTHITGAPVVFVGTGQKYNHLKKLSVKAVIKSLFS